VQTASKNWKLQFRAVCRKLLDYPKLPVAELFQNLDNGRPAPRAAGWEPHVEMFLLNVAPQGTHPRLTGISHQQDELTLARAGTVQG
jgi:hypothetical protein